MTPLERLSAALGVTVTGVRQTVVHVGGCQDHPNAWRLCVPGARYGRDPTSPGGLWTFPREDGATAAGRRADPPGHRVGPRPDR